MRIILYSIFHPVKVCGGAIFRESRFFMAYTKERKLFSDALSDTYEIVDEHDLQCNMTEYYSEGIINQSYSDLSEEKNRHLYRGLWMLKSLSLSHIPVITRIEESDGINVLWESFGGITLKEYIGNGQVSYKTLLDMLSPLLDDCETAHQNGLYFTVSPETICLTDDGKLKLNTMVDPSADFQTTIRDVAQSIFYMLTGLSYGNLREGTVDFIPSPVRILLNDVLTDQMEYTDVGDFHNELRAAIYAVEDNCVPEPSQGEVQVKARMSSGKIVAICIGFFSIVALVIRFWIL